MGSPVVNTLSGGRRRDGLARAGAAAWAVVGIVLLVLLAGWSSGG